MRLLFFALIYERQMKVLVKHLQEISVGIIVLNLSFTMIVMVVGKRSLSPRLKLPRVL